MLIFSNAFFRPHHLVLGVLNSRSSNIGSSDTRLAKEGESKGRDEDIMAGVNKRIGVATDNFVKDFSS